MKSGELTALSFARYLKAAQLLTAHFGRDRLLTDLRFDDLIALRGKFAEGNGLVHLSRQLQASRSIFQYANDTGLAGPEIRYAKARARSEEGRLRSARQAKGDRSLADEKVRPQMSRMFGSLNSRSGAEISLVLNRANFG